MRWRRRFDCRLPVVDFGILILKDMTPQRLEDRLIDFAVMVIDVVEALPNTKAGNHVGGQLIRSGTSTAPNYAEARSAESRKDIVHKMKISLMELRETMVWLKIIARKRMGECRGVPVAPAEWEELIEIITASTKRLRAASDLSHPKSSS
jgi:four helix bundle protein